MNNQQHQQQKYDKEEKKIRQKAKITFDHPMVYQMPHQMATDGLLLAMKMLPLIVRPIFVKQLRPIHLQYSIWLVMKIEIYINKWFHVHIQL